MTLKGLVTDGIVVRLGWSTAKLFILRTAGMALLFVMHAALGRQLGATGYGVVSYALSVAGIGALVATLGLPNGVMRLAAQYQEAGRWGELRGVLIRTFQIALGGALGGALLIAAFSALPVIDQALRQSLLYASISLPLVALGLWRMKAARGLGEIAAAFVPEEVILPVAVVLGVLVLSVRQPGPAIATYVGASLVALILGIVWLVGRVPPQVRTTRSETHTALWLSISLPMTVASVTQLSLSRTDALFLGALTDMGETGRYIAASRLAILVCLALRIVDMAVAPLMSAAYYGGRPHELRTLFVAGTALSFLGSLPLAALAYFMPQQLLQLFGSEYIGAAGVLRILVLGQLINAVTGPIGFLLMMTGRERLYAKAIAATAVLSIVAHVLVIPRWGGIGAAWVTAASTALLNLTLLTLGIQKVLSKPGSEAQLEPSGDPQ